jgi:uncharacterized protein YlxW (UPF0749 family)
MKADVKAALAKEREQNQRSMVEGVNGLMKAFKKVEEAVEIYKRSPNKDYKTIENALKSYKMTLENVK